jgi:molybdopterin adenylyltransferase
MMGKIAAICISKQRGTQKEPVPSARFLPDYGIEGDAHAGNWHRQVSLLSLEKIEEFRQRGADVDYGAFGENLVVEGIDFASLPVGSRLQAGEVLLEITQIGKACHQHCAIYHAVGDCIMPREGVFARVVHGGVLEVGMELSLLSGKIPYRAAVITLSDRASRGEYKDESGPAVSKRLKEAGYEVVEELLLPDDPHALQKELCRLSDQRRPDLILTTGGTGFAPRDCTPEATLAVADRQAPGIAEGLRAYSMQFTKRAVLSRGVSVIRKQTLIVNLPGSVRAVEESLDFLLGTIEHGFDLLRNLPSDCGHVKS